MSNENSKRQTVKVEAPPGGWLHPWPQCLELAQSLDSSKWALISEFVDGADAKVTTISLPNVLGALVLKGAAYRADSRERERHLEDAALLSTLVEDPLILVSELRGSDRSRILSLNSALRDPMHPAWSQLELEAKERGRYALEILARNPQNLDLDRTLGPAF